MEASPADRPRIAIVAIVDDIPDVRRGIENLVESLDLNARIYGSAAEFLSDQATLDNTACLVTDVQMPDMSGIELQASLRRDRRRFPIIFITAFPDDNVRARALAGGAFAFLEKPFDPNIFTDTLLRAIEEYGQNGRS